MAYVVPDDVKLNARIAFAIREQNDLNPLSVALFLTTSLMDFAFFSIQGQWRGWYPFLQHTELVQTRGL